MGKTSQLHYRSAVSHPSLVHSQDPFSAVKQSSFKTDITLFSLFFGGPSLGITDQRWERDLMGEADSLKVSYLSPVSFSQFENCSAQQDSPVSKTIFTLFSFFFGGPSLIASLIKTEEETLWVKLTPIAGQLLVTHLWYKVQDLFSTAIQYSFQNSFCTLLSVF